MRNVKFKWGKLKLLAMLVMPNCVLASAVYLNFMLPTASDAANYFAPCKVYVKSGTTCLRVTCSDGLFTEAAPNNYDFSGKMRWEYQQNDKCLYVVPTEASILTELKTAGREFPQVTFKTPPPPSNDVVTFFWYGRSSDFVPSPATYEFNGWRGYRLSFCKLSKDETLPQVTCCFEGNPNTGPHCPTP